MWNVDNLTRLFIVPAMKNFDALTALEKWTEENMAPDCLVGKAGKRYLDQNTETAILSISEGSNLYWWRQE